jgi:hypothetical protein
MLANQPQRGGIMLAQSEGLGKSKSKLKSTKQSDPAIIAAKKRIGGVKSF